MLRPSNGICERGVTEMLKSCPGANRAGCIGLAIGEAILDILVARDVLNASERYQVLSLSAEKLRQQGMAR